jgi:hypothetical protein
MAKIEVPRGVLVNIPSGFEDRYWLDPEVHDYSRLEDGRRYIQGRCESYDIPEKVEFVSFGIRSLTKHIKDGADDVPSEVESIFWRPEGSPVTRVPSLISVNEEAAHEYQLQSGLYAVTNSVEVDMTPTLASPDALNLFINLGYIHRILENNQSGN